MITLEPYLYDYQLYHLLPQPDRWIFNKIILAELMGYVCGPVGTVPENRGRYIVRPTMNISGMGDGGFFIRNTVGAGTAAIDKQQVPNANPGYFWSEVFEGPHCWTMYVNDVAVFGTVGTLTGDTLAFEDDVGLNAAIPLPDFLKNISRYMMLEHMGGKVIEVSPRHAGQYARQEIVDDYRTIDPAYDPDNVEFGLQDFELRDDPAGGKRWHLKPGTRRPW